ncbi:MAG TPA: hypothetical protein VHW64_10180 [Nocardioides sp.]|jgi:hypothetical protein|uniref:hypothetical protein n=1 Tax=Nocardioides sp. TaxID=35761 RepID=UPI002E31C649|nr:hypothetical protein [Nocardioides sp.]HEX3931064.1 hypothetical protein [Nocardioides sp.]
MRAERRRTVWRYHLFFTLAIAVCLAAGWFELGRARGGRSIAWVYTFEWPAYAAVFVFMWWHVVRDRPVRRPAPPGRSRGKHDIPEDDPGLRAWRAYLAELGHDDATTDRAPGSG